MFSITKNGKLLDKKLYKIDLKNKTFSTKEFGLVLDFTNEDDWTFKTGFGCVFKTGSSCIFYTSFNCIFICKEKCICKRRDVFEIIPKNKKIQLNKEKIKGYMLYINKEIDHEISNR